MNYKLIQVMLLGVSCSVYAEERSSKLLSRVKNEINNLQNSRLKQQELNFLEKIDLEENQSLGFPPPPQVSLACGFIPYQEMIPEIILSLRFQEDFETWVPIEGKSYKESFWKVSFKN